MKRKAPQEEGSTHKNRPVLFYPETDGSQPTQCVMPSSPTLPAQSSPERPSPRQTRQSGRNDLSISRRRSAVDNIGYIPENIPTPRSRPSLFAASTQASSSKQPQRTYSQAASARLRRSSRIIHHSVEPTEDIGSNAGRDQDEASEYVVDSSEEETPKAPSKAPEDNQSRIRTRRSTDSIVATSQAASISTRTSRSRFDDRTSPPAKRKSARISEPARSTPGTSRQSEAAHSSPMKRQRLSRPTPEVIELSSSDSRAVSESPSLGGNPYPSSRVISPLPPEPSSSAHPRSRSASSASSDIVLLDSPPTGRNIVVDQSPDEIEELPGPTRPPRPNRSRRRGRPRRLDSSSEPEYTLFHASPRSNPFESSPSRAPDSSYRARVVARPTVSPSRPEFVPVPEPEPEPEPAQPIASGSTLPQYNPVPSSSSPPVASRSAVSVSSSSSVAELGQRSDAPELPSWSSPLRGQTPRVLETPPPDPQPTVTRVLRMECVLLPRASRAMREAMERFDRVYKPLQSRSATGSAIPGKGKGKSVVLYVRTGRVNFAVEIPTKSGRKSKPKKGAGTGMGKGMGKGSYAAREEGRWESSSPVRDDPGTEEDYVDIEDANDNGFDPAAELRSEADIPPPDDLVVEPETPVPKKRGRKPKQTQEEDSSPFKQAGPSSPAQPISENEDPPPASPEVSASPEVFVPKSPIRIDRRAASPSTYDSLPDEVEEGADKYCHCCRGQKKGTLKMKCANLVQRRGRRSQKPKPPSHKCGSWWCQRCVLKHDLNFDPFETDFTCPMCTDICVCDKCRRRLKQPLVGKTRGSRKRTSTDLQGKGGAEAEGQESEPEPPVAPAPPSSHSASSHHSESEEESEDDDDVASSSSEDVPVKGPDYAQEMRKRGPTTWHGSRVPPPLQGANAEGPAALRNVFVPRMPRESEEDKLAEKLRTFEADYAAGADASLLGADYAIFDMGEEIGGPSREDEASEHDDINLGDFLPANKLVAADNGPECAIEEPRPQVPETQGIDAAENLLGEHSEFDEDAALSQAILQLGPGESITLNDDILQGLDAGIEDAHRHFYRAPDFSDLDAKLDDLDPERSLQMRYDSVLDIMLGAGADEPIDLGDFHDAPVYPARRSYLSEVPVFSLAPADLIRTPTSEAEAEFFLHPDANIELAPDAELDAKSDAEQAQTPQADPLPLPEPEPESHSESRHEPRPEPQVDPDLDAEGEPEPEFTMTTDPESAKSTVLETPSPQFGVDVGLEIVGPGSLLDLFGGRISPYEESIASASRAPGSSVADDTFSGGSRMPVSEEKAGDPSDSAPAPAPASLTFVLPTPERQVELRESLRTRFHTRSVTRSIAEAEAKNSPMNEGRVTRSRRRG